MTTVFADDKTITTPDEDQQTGTDWLGRSIVNVPNGSKRDKIKITSVKLVHINYTLHKTVFKPA